MKPIYKSHAPPAVLAFAVLLSAVLSGARAARGQVDRAGPGVHVVAEVTSCEGGLTHEVRQILHLELGEMLLASDAVAKPASDRLSIRCVGTLAWLEASGGDAAQPIDRTLSLDDFPVDLAPRALALAGIELLASRSPALRVRLQAKRAPASQPRLATPSALPSSAVAPAPAPPTRELRLGLTGAWRAFLVERGVSAWGGQAVVTRDLGRWWQLHADAEVVGSGRRVALGQTRALLGSCGVDMAARAGHQDIGVALGLGARLGFARLVGNATDQSTVRAGVAAGPWGGPMARASAHVGVGPAALVLAFEVGRSLGTVRGLADGRSALVIQDTWLALSLGGVLRR